MASEIILGIDLGTTNSEVACIVNGQPTALKGADDLSPIVPSVVGLSPSGALLVGRSALNQAIAAPERTIVSVKRKMGSDEQLTLGDQSYTPQEISACILRTLKERAEATLGAPLSKAVVTVPAYFTDAQRQATREAGAIAGLEVVSIVNEPTAAALAYGASAAARGDILVYDLGGGTFDVSLVRAEQGVVEVLATAGDNYLGGDDLDACIVERLVSHLSQVHGLEVTGDLRCMARLRRAAEAAKVQLSSAPHASIQEDHLGEVDGSPIHLDYELSREEFEQAITPLLDRSLEATRRVLADANIQPSELDKILLVGGSSRVPLVRTKLREALAQQPHEEVDPELCVALGAALQAGINMGLSVDGVLVDVTPYTFGTSCWGVLNGVPYERQFAPIIHRNSKLPIERSEVFFRMHDDQKEVEVEVFQGEDPDALNNVRVGKFMFSGLKPGPAGNDPGVILTYKLNVDGILHVTATERVTGKKISCVVENAMAQPDAESLRASQERMARLLSSKEDSAQDTVGVPIEPGAGQSFEPITLPSELRDLLARCEQVMDRVGQDDRAELTGLINELQDSHREGAAESTLAARQKLDDILFYLE